MLTKKHLKELTVDAINSNLFYAAANHVKDLIDKNYDD